MSLATTSVRRAVRQALAIGAAGAVLAIGIGTSQALAAPTPSPSPTPTVSAALPKLPTAPKVRIGFFANLTHAPALVAQQLRLFEQNLNREGTQVEYVLFNAGPAVIEAMKGGAIDVSYIGPNPSITGYNSTNGTLLKVVSGATSGGAYLVVKPGINTVADLRGKKIATPQLGNTQDVALRTWLKTQGLQTTVAGGGDVTVIPTDNAQSLSLFKRGDIDGAWVPEPWASRLILEAGAKVLVDEKTLWQPSGQYVTTNIIASQAFLNQYPGTVRSILQANNTAIRYIASNVLKSRDIVQEQITKWTGKPLPDAVINRSWGNVRFTWDPLPLTLKQGADDAVSVGLLTLGPKGVSGIYDLRLLNSVLKASKARTVTAGGLGLQ
ncbi:MAG: ABC transporter substrate-binding protein [Candidatus Nanopelagicales bacterium]|jgi:NitT/TauT family transport system substrate-binding protein